MESHILNKVQQTSSRVKNVLDDSERLLAELKSRRVITQPVVKEDTFEHEEVDYDEGYADDEAEGEGEGETEGEVEPETQGEGEGEPEAEGEVEPQVTTEEDDEEDEEYSTFFCCRTRRGVNRLLL